VEGGRKEGRKGGRGRVVLGCFEIYIRMWSGGREGRREGFLPPRPRLTQPLPLWMEATVVVAAIPGAAGAAIPTAVEEEERR